MIGLCNGNTRIVLTLMQEMIYTTSVLTNDTEFFCSMHQTLSPCFGYAIDSLHTSTILVLVLVAYTALSLNVQTTLTYVP